MKAKLIERKNPQNKTEKKLYASGINAGRKTLRDISADIQGRSSLTYGDIQNVLANFVDCLPPYLLDGFSIQLGEFGTLRISLSSEGAATAKDFNTGKIKARIIFTPGVALKRQLQNISFEIVRK